jgi:hypothetical protein
MKILNQNRNDSNNSRKIHEESGHPQHPSHKKSEALEIIWHGNHIVQVEHSKGVTQIVTPS